VEDAGRSDVVVRPRDAGVEAAQEGGANLVDLTTGSSTVLDSETAIAYANGWLLAVWTAVDQTGMSAIGYAFSKDNGATWTPPDAFTAPAGLAAGDPVVTSDAQGNFYVGFLGIDVNAGRGGPVFVRKALAGQTTFQPPVTVSDAPDGGDVGFDKPWMTVTSQGTLVIIYSEMDAADSVLVVARSTDGGQTFSRVRVGAGEGGYNRVRPCVSGARMWMAAMGFGSGVTVVLRWSDDDGETWPAQNRSEVPTTAESDVAYVDPNVACNGNDVWVLYGRSPDAITQDDTQMLTKIRLAHSANGGTSFDFRVDVQDTLGGARSMLPEIVREPGGALDLVYYAGTTPRASGTFRRARSTDDGRTFAPSVEIDPGIVFTPARADVRWLGDYVGLAFGGGKLSTTYVHNAGGKARVYYYGAAP
jgi:hypothetical protein